MTSNVSSHSAQATLIEGDHLSPLYRLHTACISIPTPATHTMPVKPKHITLPLDIYVVAPCPPSHPTPLPQNSRCKNNAQFAVQPPTLKGKEAVVYPTRPSISSSESVNLPTQMPPASIESNHHHIIKPSHARNETRKARSSKTTTQNLNRRNQVVGRIT